MKLSDEQLNNLKKLLELSQGWLLAKVRVDEDGDWEVKVVADPVSLQEIVRAAAERGKEKV